MPTLGKNKQNKTKLYACPEALMKENNVLQSPRSFQLKTYSVISYRGYIQNVKIFAPFLVLLKEAHCQKDLNGNFHIKSCQSDLR